MVHVMLTSSFVRIKSTTSYVGKIVQMVLMGCISRSGGQKLGFQNACLKNLLVWKYKAQSFHV